MKHYKVLYISNITNGYCLVFCFTPMRWSTFFGSCLCVSHFNLINLTVGVAWETYKLFMILHDSLTSFLFKSGRGLASGHDSIQSKNTIQPIKYLAKERRNAWVTAIKDATQIK